jgi:hypothetical protein
MFAGSHILVDMDMKVCSNDCPLRALDAARIEDDRWDVIAPVDDHLGMEALIEAHGNAGGYVSALLRRNSSLA